MWKFIRGKGQQPSPERQQLQKELFAFRKVNTFFYFIHFGRCHFVDLMDRLYRYNAWVEVDYNHCHFIWQTSALRKLVMHFLIISVISESIKLNVRKTKTGNTLYQLIRHSDMIQPDFWILRVTWIGKFNKQNPNAPP